MKAIETKNSRCEVLVVEKSSEKYEKLEKRIRRCHVNLGHPSKKKFLKKWKTAGASEQALKTAKQFRRDVCVSKQPPVSHPVVNMKKAEGFNQQICMDVFAVHVEQPRTKTLKMLNIICEGIGLQMVVPLWKGANSKDIPGVLAAVNWITQARVD